MWCDVCWGNSLSIWKGRARESRTTFFRYTCTHDKLPSCHAVEIHRDPFGIHLGSIGQLHHNFGILDDSMLPFSKERKNHGLCTTGDQLPLAFLSGNTPNWIQNSCSRRGRIPNSMLLSIAVAGWSGGLRGGREIRTLCAKLRRFFLKFLESRRTI